MSTKNSWSPDLYAEAWMFATKKHDGQTYGGAAQGERIPYINHLASVAAEVTWALQHTKKHCNADLAIACALLHDTIEDTQTTYEEIETAFGKAVADGVLALTKSDTIADKSEKMVDSLKRILEQPDEIAMVKMADRIVNLYHPPFYWNREKREAYQEEAMVIHEALQQADEVIAARLQERIERYAQFFRE